MPRDAKQRIATAYAACAEWTSVRWRSAARSWTLFWRDIWRENVPRLVPALTLPRLVLALTLVVLVAALSIGLVEYNLGGPAQRATFGHPLNAIYWAVVTISTVGYGDISPQSALGRALTIVFILLGMVLVSVFTATLASVFTAKKIKEGRGLEKVKATDHVVVCGWNRHLDAIVKFLARSDEMRRRSFVLINMQPESDMNEFMYRYSHLDVHLVHGDYIQESVLRRANVEEAFASIILTDESAQDRAVADNRTLQAALAIKSLNQDIKLIAEALDPENERHLKRANVDDVIVNGEFTGYLLAASTASPGLDLAIRELLSVEVRNDIIRNRIPESFQGKTFNDMQQWFRTQGALAIGIIVEEKRLSLDDVLVDDFSAVDRFIRSTFSAAGKELAFMGRGKSEVVMNPPDDRVIGPNDDAIIISPKPVPV